MKKRRLWPLLVLTTILVLLGPGPETGRGGPAAGSVTAPETVTAVNRQARHWAPFFIAKPAMAQEAPDREDESKEEQQEDPDPTAIKEKLAFSKQQAGDVEGAMEIYRELVENDQAGRQSRMRYARLLNGEQQHQDALRVLKPLDLEKENGELTELKARTAWWAREYDQARRYYKHWLDLQPDNAEARNIYNRLVRMAQKPMTIADYQAILRRNPNNQKALAGLAALYQKNQRHLEAAELYQRLESLRPGPDPQLQLRIARSYFWAEYYAEAVEYYQTYAALRPEAEAEVWAEYSQSLLESGRAELAFNHSRSALKQYPDSPGLLEVAARSATELDLPEPAVRYLERLSQQRELSADERQWLASQYHDAGMYEPALRIYLALMGWPGDGACPRISAADLAGRPAELVLGAARAAAGAERHKLSAAAYLAYSKIKPDDAEVLKEASDSLTEQEMYQAALKVTRRLLWLQGPEGLRLRLARLNFFLENYQDAEKWADAELQVEGDQAQALFLLGRIAHLREKYYQAARLFQRATRFSPDDPEIRLWWGYALEQTNRNLAAFEEYSNALRLCVERPEEAYLYRGDALRKIGDHDLAAKNYDLAEKHGADPEELGQSRATLEAKTRPRFIGRGYYLSDSNNFRQFKTESGFDFWPKKALRTGARYDFMEVEQDGVSYDMHGVRLYARQWRPSPCFKLEGSVGAMFYGQYHNGDPDPLMIGDLEAEFLFRPTTSFSPFLYRESFYEQPGRHDPRHFNRVVRLRDLPADASKFGGGVRFEKQLHPSRDELFLEVGSESYDADGHNNRFWGFGHYQHEVYSQPERNIWLAVKPNVYFERFIEQNPAYFTPEAFAALGGMIHFVKGWEAVELELEANPQLQIEDDKDAGAGGHGLVKLAVNLDPVTAGVEAFGFWDENDQYTLWQAGWFLEAKF